MIKIGFGNRLKPKSFGYIPRFYDPVKDELNERLSKYQSTDNEDVSLEKMKGRIQSGIRLKYNGDPTLKKSAEKKSNVRLVYIIIILIMISYVIISSDKITSMLEVFSR
ncbi:MAG: hypothetical protein H7X99_02620 [Saprospiraceae bacterium]|nr:hypothetical protein [Saprospiraceae bacterium]